jgi:hypothetical protein
MLILEKQFLSRRFSLYAVFFWNMIVGTKIGANSQEIIAILS